MRIQNDQTTHTTAAAADSVFLLAAKFSCKKKKSSPFNLIGLSYDGQLIFYIFSSEQIWTWRKVHDAFINITVCSNGMALGYTYRNLSELCRNL